MARERTPIDISGVPELLRIVEEARALRASRVLTRDKELLAVLTPLMPRTHRSSKSISKADLAAFQSAAGTWNDVDTDTFLTNNYESRKRSTGPSVEL